MAAWLRLLEFGNSLTRLPRALMQHSVNTEHFNGVCILLKDKVGQELLFNSPYTLDDQVTVCHQNLHFSHSMWCSQYKNRRNSVSSICAIWSHSICTVRTQGPFCCCSSWTRYVTLDWSKKYESIDRYICIAARKILENHLWYRSGCRILDQNPVTDKLKIKLIGRKNAKLMRIEWQKMVQ